MLYPSRKSEEATMLAAIATLLLAVSATPVPKVTGPIPVTADSYPFMAANHNTPSIDLSKLGYVEEEYIVTGNANVYDWAADGTLSVKTPNAPYGTRILVRRPKDRARFSGSVIVELLFPARRFDWAMMWGFSHDYLTEHGDAWVGISLPAVADGLKKFNPTRYAAVSFRWAAACRLYVQALYLTTQGSDVATYANAIHAS